MVDLKIEIPPAFLDEEDKVLRVARRTKEMWAVELDLLAELRRVCNKHGIRFFAISGTLIGAARHKGFIPWDDDIDVVMRREEYEKLVSVAPIEFSDPYFLQTPFSDPESGYGFAKLMNCSTAAVNGSNIINGKIVLPARHGILIDIFPLDNIPDGNTERNCFFASLAKQKSKVVSIKRRRMLARHWRIMPKTLGNLVRALLGKIELFWKKVSGRDRMIDASRRLNIYAQKYNEIKTQDCAAVTNTPFPRRHEVFHISDFDESVDLQFEMTTIPCPRNYEDLLERTFGNWREHVVGGSAHGYVIVDVCRSYKEYL